MAKFVREFEENHTLCRDDKNWKDEKLEDIQKVIILGLHICLFSWIRQ